LQNNVSTVAVLAHGLDRVYPSVHWKTAIEMLERGAWITEFPSGTEPDRFNFVKRNRIVAGMADAVVVVESGDRGGSLITADIANSYYREVFAIPGRITDAR
jgi:DNA processing protein